MKIINTKYLVFTTWKENDINYDKFAFRMFKHEKSPFFKRYSKVIEITIFWRVFIFEF